MQILTSTHAMSIKTSSIVTLYCTMTTQHLDTDTVYQLYHTLAIYCGKFQMMLLLSTGRSECQ